MFLECPLLQKKKRTSGLNVFSKFLQFSELVELYDNFFSFISKSQLNFLVLLSISFIFALFFLTELNSFSFVRQSISHNPFYDMLAVRKKKAQSRTWLFKINFNKASSLPWANGEENAASLLEQMDQNNQLYSIIVHGQFRITCQGKCLHLVAIQINLHHNNVFE